MEAAAQATPLAPGTAIAEQNSELDSSKSLRNERDDDEKRAAVNGTAKSTDSDDKKPRLSSRDKANAAIGANCAATAGSDSEDDVPLAQRKRNVAMSGSKQDSPDIKGAAKSTGVVSRTRLATAKAAGPSEAPTKSSAKPAGISRSPSLSTPDKKTVGAGSSSAKVASATSKTAANLSKSRAASSSKGPTRPPAKRPSEDSEDEKPLKRLKVEPKKEARESSKRRAAEQKPAAPSKKAKVEEDSDDSCREEEEEEEDNYEDEDEDDVPLKKRMSTSAGKKVVQTRKVETKTVVTTKKPGSSGQKVWWTTLQHNGVIFPPPYQPHGVKMLYDGKPVVLTPEQEEVATMFAVMRDTDYATKAKFRENFWTDWKKLLGPNHQIKKLESCDFTPIYEWHLKEKEKKKQMSTEEKKRLKAEKEKLEEKYTWALVDGVKEKVGNYKVEPPNLFRGRGEHPKMGKLKRRIFPEDIVINIGKDAPVPECPMPGHKWKEIRHDNTVTWLAFWNDPINTRECKYVFLHQSSSLKAQSDKEKYEKARKLKDYIANIRKTYTKDFTSSDVGKRQIAVASYLIDRLALRAGNEKDDDEADTVGCCSLKVEHVSTMPPKSLEFDFLGKDSIRYFNTVEVEEKVYAAIKDFKKGKKAGEDLFDKLDTNKLNAHLKAFMPGLTAKVFRTYNASITLDNQLEHTEGANVNEKTADYLRANKQVAILCNHQRSVPKTHTAQMEKLEEKMAELKALREEIAKDLDRAKKGKPPTKDKEGKTKRNQSPEQLEKKLEQMDKKIEKMELDMRTKDDMKTVALGTSKINYMDPRITVAWCKRNEVPIEKVFNKSLLGKFAWAMDVEPDFRF